MKKTVLTQPIYLALLICAVCLSVITKAQQPAAAIEAYADKYSPERAYIHYDKPAYSAGETIWFKAYLLNELMPVAATKTFYVDWIDDKGNLLLHTVSPLVDAVTNGQYEIPADYKGKFIHVRAYTRWMLNFDSSFLYTKDIRVISKDVNKTIDKTPAIPTITFFPEGGDAVAGVVNKIAFKANDQWGRPVKVKGVIISSKGQVGDSLRSIHDGMGFFFLTPQPGVTYSAKWKDEKQVERTTALPAIKAQGVSLMVSVSGDNRFFEINYSPELAASVDSLHMVGTIYQHQAFQIARPTSGPSIKGSIPVKDLPSGILTITVFDNKWNAIAERITYVNNEEYIFKPEMEVQHWGLSKRARNEIKITVPDSLVANLSVAVTDEAIGTDSSSNIISHLFLSSELKGDVFNPAYYLSAKTNTISQHLDLVMLTHGWRRFKWNEVLSGKTPKPVYGRDTAYMSLSGSIIGVMPGQVPAGSTVVLLVKQKDKEGQVILVPVETNGKFNDPSTILFDTAQVYYQFQKKELKGASAQFMTDRLAMPPIKSIQGSNLLWPDTTGNYRQWQLADEANRWAESQKVKVLENVTVKSKGKTPLQLMDEKYSSGLFNGGDSYQFDLVNDPFSKGAMNIFTYLQGKVAGLQITTTSDGATLQWRGGSPQLYLDQMQADASLISSVNVNDVAYIKVFRPPFMGGFNGGNGAIAIYTRRGDDVKQEPGKGMSNNKIFGYTPIREFFSPKYSSFTQNEQRDIRTTLYWNPSVVAAPNQRTQVLTFYNNDVSKSFRVIIEGMTTDGRVAHIEQIME